MEQVLAMDINRETLDLATANCSHCKCPRNCRSLTMGLKLEPRGPVRRESQRPHTFWRPWIYRSHKPKVHNIPYACSLRENPRVPQKPAEYNHPVRLFWPKSKSLAHTYQEAADLLRNFPVQATISLYNDSESDTDSEEDSSEEENDSGFESE